MIQSEGELEGSQEQIRYDYKLQALNEINRSLKNEKLQWLSMREEIVSRLKQLQLQNQHKQNEMIQLRQQKVQMVASQQLLKDRLKVIEEEYRTLFNCLYTDHKMSERQLILRQIQLNNQLNSLAREGDSQIIKDLKEIVTSKDKQIRQINKQYRILRGKMLQISGQYHEQLMKLRQQKIRAEFSHKNVLSNENNRNQINEKIFQQSKRNTEYEIQILKGEVTRLQQVLGKVEGEYHQIFRQKIKVEQKLRNQRPFDYNFEDIFELVKQNQRLSNEIIQVRKIDAFMVMIKQNQSGDSILNQIIKIRTQLQEQLNLNYSLRLSNSKLSDQINENKKIINNLRFRQDQYILKNQIIQQNSQKIITKLHAILRQIIPCYDLYGYSSYDITEEEKIQIDQHLKYSQRQSQTLKKDIKDKTKQINTYKHKIVTLEAEKEVNTKFINRIEEQNKNLKQEVAKISTVVQSLINQAKNKKRQKFQQRYQDDGEDDDVQRYFDEQIQSLSNEPVQIIARSNSRRSYPSRQNQKGRSLENGKLWDDLNGSFLQVKVGVLEKAVLQLQEDRQKILQIIRQKEFQLIELNTQLQNVRLHNPCSIIQFYGSHTPQTKEITIPIQIKVIKTVELENTIKQLRQRIQDLGAYYNTSSQLLVNEWERRLAEKDSQNEKILLDYRRLCEQYESFKQNFSKQSRSERRDHEDRARQEIEQEVIQLNQEDTIVDLNREENLISESTIQTISELLKRYDKEIQKLLGLYEASAHRFAELKNACEEQANSADDSALEEINQRLSQLQQQVASLETLALLKQGDVQLLQLQLRSREEQEGLWRSNQRAERKEMQLTISSLRQQVENLNTELRQLQSIHLEAEKKSQSSNFNGEAFGTAFSLLNAKNQQISLLETRINELLRQAEARQREIQSIDQNFSKTLTPLQEHQLKQVKKFLEQEDLAALLASSVRLLQERRLKQA